MFTRLLSATLVASFSTAAFADKAEPETTLVTATRTPVSYSETLAAVTVFDRQDIERIQATDIFGLLSRTAGVSFVRNGGHGSSTSLFLRGNQSDHSLFLIDGVRIGSATLGSAALSSLSLFAVERIEIIRGPKSALYGADAIGGVVNIITRAVTEPRELSIETGFGSNDTTETNVYGGVSGEAYSLTVVASAFDTDGVDNTSAKVRLADDNDAFRNNSLAVNYRQSIGDKVSLKVAYNRYDGENEFDSNCTNATTFAAVDCLIYAETLVDSLSGRVNINVSDKLTTSLQFGQSKDESNNLADNVSLVNTFNGGEFNTTKTEATWLANFTALDNQTITVGLDYQLDEVDGTTAYDETSRYNQAGFVQLQSDFGVVDAVMALRYDDNEQFGDHTTVSVTAGVAVSERLRVIASYGEAFKAPTFNDLYFPNFGDPTFVPEEAKNYELALKGSFDAVAFTLAAYQNDVSNLIQFNSSTFVTDQISKATITGLEFDVTTQVADWSLAITGQIIDPENDSNGKLLRRRAEQTVSFDADTQWNDTGFGFSIRAESERFDDVANTTAGRLAGYSLVDFRAQYIVNDEWRVKLKIDNAFDKQYATARDFSLGDFEAVGREAFVSVVYTPKL